MPRNVRKMPGAGSGGAGPLPEGRFRGAIAKAMVVALGGTPMAKPSAFRELKDLKAILKYDLELERQAIKHYTERIQQADAVGQIGLRVQLEGVLADETDHAEEIVRLLGK